MAAPAPTDRLIKEVNWILRADQAHAERMAAEQFSRNPRSRGWRTGPVVSMRSPILETGKIEVLLISSAKPVSY